MRSPIHLQAIFRKSEERHAPGATFLVLDVNGEFRTAFEKLPSIADIGVERVILDGSAAADKFRVSHWFLDLAELKLLLQALRAYPISILRMALGLTTLLGR
ncbi:hypothetical protein [Bradyrhizobium stylosanthis]|uniref:Uncharacterized protein n=1 Tax=Bradyrhizobium stylosanthis TaxID=1803665 RepID=A0A560DPI3_9BRAD|nr:hypothetical protein [Bradyrhizobium stylosanthis]TWA99016.1 hypothetical protein FBZ96_105696 [Bradyrhizobium stylosanthis]